MENYILAGTDILTKKQFISHVIKTLNKETIFDITFWEECQGKVGKAYGIISYNIFYHGLDKNHLPEFVSFGCFDTDDETKILIPKNNINLVEPFLNECVKNVSAEKVFVQIK